MTDDDNDKFDKIYDDKVEEMTYGRRWARTLSKYNWYFPISETDDNFEENIAPENQIPKLDEAWANFEHIGLPRAFPLKPGDKTRERAEPGETDKTKLYPVWGTSIEDMGDFGVGVGLYFTTLQYYALMTFLAGLINIPALMFYNDNYSPTDRQDLDNLLKVSAVCTQTVWQPCPTCTKSDWDRFPIHATDRFATGVASDGSELSFIRVNDCFPGNSLGISALVSMLFVIASVYLIDYLQRGKTVAFDAVQQTSTDYSIIINNPPPNAKNPDSWKQFFESTFKVTVNVCTVAIDNPELIKALIARRKSLRALDNLLPRDKDIDEDDLDKLVEEKAYWSVPLWKKIICCAKDPYRIVADIKQKEIEIVDRVKALGENCDVVRVFVTFDKEKSQRKVLKKLSVAGYKEKDFREKKSYDGKTVLLTDTPDEPVSIRWNDLDDNLMKQRVQALCTWLLSIGLIIAGGFLTAWAQMRGALLTSVVITIVSVVTPSIVAILVAFESHHDETSKTASKYLKVTVIRWVTTVLTPLVVTPFANVLDSGTLLNRVRFIFITELVRGPLLQCLDLIGKIFRHIIGPRAEDQRRMNSYFSGTPYSIGDQYTDITKVLFLALFYSILYPLGFFFASAIFAVYYWVDKYCILRVYKQGPKIGPAVSKLSAFFFKLSILGYAIMLSFLYSQFPYDNACISEDEDLSAYTGSINLTLLDDTRQTLTIDATTIKGYMYCKQEVIRYGKLPALPSLQEKSGGTWMTEDQEDFLTIFGWASVAVLVLVGGTAMFNLFMIYIFPFFFKGYKKPNFDCSDKNFEDVNEIAAYVPQVQVRGFEFPFLLCDTRDIDEDHIGWTDPRMGYKKHNLSSDVKEIFKRQKESIHSDEPIFSIVKSYGAARTNPGGARGTAATFFASLTGEG